MSELPKNKGSVTLAKEVQEAIGGFLGFVVAWFVCLPIFYIGVGIYWLSELPREKKIFDSQDGMDRLYGTDFPTYKERQIQSQIDFNEDR